MKKRGKDLPQSVELSLHIRCKIRPETDCLMLLLLQILLQSIISQFWHDVLIYII